MTRTEYLLSCLAAYDAAQRAGFSGFAAWLAQEIIETSYGTLKP